MPAPVPRLSIVTTLYKSAPYVAEFCLRAAEAARSLVGQDFEIVLVNDGSPDASLEIARQCIKSYPNLRVIELSRNFGHHAAIMAGLERSRGDLVFYIDSDLEEDPGILVEFSRKLTDELDVVFGFHNRAGEPLLRRWTSRAFWGLLSAISETEITVNMANVRLMRRVYVDALVAMPDRNLFLGGMFPWPGFRQQGVPIERSRREATSYSLAGRMRLALIAAISFSKKPLLVVFALGACLAAGAFAVGILLILNRLVSDADVLDGWTSLMISVWFLGGLLLGAIGILGLYIAQIFDQVRGRPRYFVRGEYDEE